MPILALQLVSSVGLNKSLSLSMTHGFHLLKGCSVIRQANPYKVLTQYLKHHKYCVLAIMIVIGSFLKFQSI